jgi:Amt family ammonium transporter
MSSNSTRVICALLLALAMPVAWSDVAAPADATSGPTEPQLVGADKISAGDTAWMLTSTGHVLLMTIPGLDISLHGESLE